MQFFLDSANYDEIAWAVDYGLIDGVTTNPTLLSRETTDWKTQARKIVDLVDGPVSLEVVGTEAEAMIEEAKALVEFGDNVVVKIPLLLEGMKAVKELSALGIKTNVTLCFSPLQALLAAKAGATYISPFIGRLDDIGQNGMELIEQVVTIYENYGYETNVLVASVRNPMHIADAAMLGADVVTIPAKVIKQIAAHPLTDKGLESFLADWDKVFGGK
jgi:transaldolase